MGDINQNLLIVAHILFNFTEKLKQKQKFD